MCCSAIHHKRTRMLGFTLIEVLVTIVVIGIASVSMMGVFTSTIRTSADPMIQHQAIAIAEAYMEEIQLKSFAIGPGNTRQTYDDIRDYNLLSENTTDQTGTAIGNLSDYSISVSVTGTAFSGITSANAMLIQVTVSHAAISDITVSGFRTNY